MKVTFIERQRGDDERCGTTTGWSRHQQRGEKFCDACAHAKSEADKRWRSAPERTRTSRLHSKAQARALKLLKDAHLDEYRALYVEQKAELHAEFIRAGDEPEGESS